MSSGHPLKNMRLATHSGVSARTKFIPQKEFSVVYVMNQRAVLLQQFVSSSQRWGTDIDESMMAALFPVTQQRWRDTSVLFWIAPQNTQRKLRILMSLQNSALHFLWKPFLPFMIAFLVRLWEKSPIQPLPTVACELSQLILRAMHKTKRRRVSERPATHLSRNCC